MKDFLNPKSMITPGMAGALVMFLSNSICFQFPEIAPRWAALLLSFVLGGIVITAARLQFVSAAGFWLINSLIIFAVAAGSAGVASKTTATTATNSTNSMVDFLISSAHAQAPSSTSTAVPTKAELQAQIQAANARLAEQQQQLADAQQQAAKAAAEAEVQRQALEAQRAQEVQKTDQAAKEKSNRFFKEW
jgi:hypothetical protein